MEPYEYSGFSGEALNNVRGFANQIHASYEDSVANKATKKVDDYLKSLQEPISPFDAQGASQTQMMGKSPQLGASPAQIQPRKQQSLLDILSPEERQILSKKNPHIGAAIYMEGINKDIESGNTTAAMQKAILSGQDPTSIMNMISSKKASMAFDPIQEQIMKAPTKELAEELALKASQGQAPAIKERILASAKPYLDQKPKTSDYTKQLGDTIATQFLSSRYNMDSATMDKEWKKHLSSILQDDSIDPRYRGMVSKMATSQVGDEIKRLKANENAASQEKHRSAMEERQLRVGEKNASSQDMDIHRKSMDASAKMLSNIAKVDVAPGDPDYLTKLALGLKPLSPKAREVALQYYQSMMEDASAMNEIAGHKTKVNIKDAMNALRGMIDSSGKTPDNKKETKQIPGLDEFILRAKKLNPGMTYEAIEKKYYEKYPDQEPPE